MIFMRFRSPTLFYSHVYQSRGLLSGLKNTMEGEMSSPSLKSEHWSYVLQD